MFQEGFVIASGKPVPAEEQEFELPLEIFLCDPLAVMILQIARRVREISNHTNQLGTVTDACLSAIPVVVRVQGRRQPLCGSRYSQQFHELPIQWGLWHPLFQRKPSGQLRLVRETINHEDQKGFERGAENDASCEMRLRSLASQGFLPVETRQPPHFFF